MNQQERRASIIAILAATATLAASASAAGADAAAVAVTPAAAAADPRELPSYMIPNIPDAAEAYWSPDSHSLIAQTRDPRAVRTARGGEGALEYIFTEDGKSMWAVNTRGQDACSFFFPDGKRVVWTSTRDHLDMPVGNWSDSDDYPQGAELYSSDLKGGDIKRLTNNKWYEAEVSVSPDGKWITFGRQIDGNMDIWVMRADGSGEAQVTHSVDWQEGAPFFMPDSEHIMFRAWRKSEYKKVRPTPMTVFTIKRDGTDWRRHTYDRGMNWHPVPAPDGHHYVYVRAVTETNWDIMLGDLAGGEPRRLTYFDGMDILAQVSPDGRKMNWSRSTGAGFMQGMRTFIMDVSSLQLGRENFRSWDPSWGTPMHDDDPVLAAVIAGDWRSPEQRARDAARHPAESLDFWGLKPGAAVLEVEPGGGWWTQILAPYAARTGGQYFATAPDLANPALSPAARAGRQAFEQRFSNAAIYGKVQLLGWGATAAPLPENTFDLIIVSRALHNWLPQPDALERNFAQLARALKRGGVLAIEQHRANPGPQDPKAESGYVTEAFVIEQAAKVGLRQVARSEINANPRDTKDHPFGVWTLPPTRTSVPEGSSQPSDPAFDHSKYDAIGESDRMTLRFTRD